MRLFNSMECRFFDVFDLIPQNLSTMACVFNDELFLSDITPLAKDTYNVNQNYDVGLIDITHRKLGDVPYSKETLDELIAIQTNKNVKLLVVHDLGHCDDVMNNRINYFLNNCMLDLSTVIVLTSDLRYTTNKCRVVYSMHLLNRTSQYHMFRKELMKLWYHVGPNGYTLKKINLNATRTRKFISANRLHNAYREHLVNELQPYQHEGYISSVWNYNVLDGEVLVSAALPRMGYVPLNHKYYNDTFVSIYVESVTDISFSPTEKTYEPFTKGHFIIPFSSQHFIRDLRVLGFMFPDFIDYSYDEVPNIDHRFAAYLYSIRKFLSLPLEQISNEWHKNRHIILNNRNQMFIIRKSLQTLINIIQDDN